MRGAETAGLGFLFRADIDGDDRKRVAELRALDDAEADAAATEHRNLSPGRTARC